MIKPMAAQILLPMLSLNKNNAMNDVAAISKLINRDVLPAVVMFKPSIRNMGAAISRATIKTMNGKSSFESLASRLPDENARLAKSIKSMPVPAPRYSSDAIIKGGIVCMRILDTGIFSPKNKAARKA